MSNSLTIVLEDQVALSDICGINDINLKTIEKALDVRVLSRGNEILLDSDDESKHKLFKQLIEQLTSLQRSGYVPDPDMVNAVYQSIRDGNDDAKNLVQDLAIVIPGNRKIFPRSLHQAEYIQGMNTHDVVFCIGPAGTGKTYLAVAHALKEILNKERKKLILTRPVVEAGESLGFLPGDLTQKVSPYLRPLYDAMDDMIPVDLINRFEEHRTIEIAPLAYMRGRSLRNSYIILDEAQNTTREQMKMFLTRLGEGSKAVITGDITQIDLPKKNQSGLLHCMKILTDIPEIYFSFLDTRDVVRNAIVKKIINAYENEQPE
ncbi:MAG TPA: PhoH family protein [Spirochaetia bacterium]|nr:PhoH family protein [Spirochaetia bacterium]